MFLLLPVVAKYLSMAEFSDDFNQLYYTGQFKASICKLQNTWKQNQKRLFLCYKFSYFLGIKYKDFKIVI